MLYSALKPRLQHTRQIQGIGVTDATWDCISCAMSVTLLKPDGACHVESRAKVKMLQVKATSGRYTRPSRRHSAGDAGNGCCAQNWTENLLYVDIDDLDTLKMVVVVLMGVCGCGKTTVGEALALRLGWPFRDADEFHSEANKQKMSSGVPLTDEDRQPWLVSVHRYIKSVQDKSQCAVVTCSALKRRYRDILRTGETGITSQTPSSLNNPSSSPPPLSSASSSSSPSSRVLFVLLEGSREVLEARLAGRKGHFMSPDLLTSQLAILEAPEPDEDSLVVNIDADVSQIVSAIAKRVQHYV